MAGLAAIHADPLGLLVAFGAGMLSFLSPCVLPLVPAYLSMVSGLSAAELSALRTEPRPALVPVPAGAMGTEVSGDTDHIEESAPAVAEQVPPRHSCSGNGAGCSAGFSPSSPASR